MPNESVVESMGKTVADHADAKRGCHIETYTNEAVVHWNAPPIAKSRAFCIKVLKQHFGDNWRRTNPNPDEPNQQEGVLWAFF